MTIKQEKEVECYCTVIAYTYKRSLWVSQYAEKDFGLVEWLAGVNFYYRWVVEGQVHGHGQGHIRRGLETLYGSAVGGGHILCIFSLYTYVVLGIICMYQFISLLEKIATISGKSKRNIQNTFHIIFCLVNEPNVFMFELYLLYIHINLNWCILLCGFFQWR